MNTTSLSALEIALRVRAGELSAMQVLEEHLAQISAVDGVSGQLDPPALPPCEEQKVHAFIQVTADLARQQAEQVKAKVARG